MENIAVIFGGKTVEHDISIITGLSIIKNLSCIYNIVPIYIDKTGEFWTGENLKESKAYPFSKGKKCFFKQNSPNLYIKSHIGYSKIKIDCAILGVHGGIYEGGALQGLLELSNIPYTNADILGSSVCMNKDVTKLLARALNIPVVKFQVFSSDTNVDSLLENLNLNFPIILKPNSGGSSIGIFIAHNLDEFVHAFDNVKKYDTKILCEELLDNICEANITVCNINGNLKLSSIEKVEMPVGIYNFEDKYESTTNREISAKFPIKTVNEIANYTQKLASVLKLNGARFDYFLTEENKIYLNEINTIPGSLAYYLWKDDKISFTQYLNELIKNAKIAFSKKTDLKTLFKSKVLKNLDNIQKVIYK